jgi:HlyD family secretion protein
VKGEILALIDTTLLKLQEAEIDAGMRSIRTRITSVDAQNEILDQQIENLAVNISRTEKMLSDGAATRKQLDDLLGQEAVLKKQIAANNTQKSSVMAELALYESKKGTVAEQVSRCRVKSPISGTLIQKYAEEGEVTAAGKPLAKVADLSLVKLKVYVSGAMLSRVSAGEKCTVRIDKGEKDYYTYTGTVSTISEKAEFTPKIIQTKEERVTLVYAVTIEVANDGKIKAGMPGEAIFMPRAR